MPVTQRPPTGAAAPYDALLLVSFGGPERPADVIPFLENVTGGRGVPPERLAEVAEHYLAFGGRSPINDQCRELVAAIEADFKEHGIDLPVYWGNRNWQPSLHDTISRMADDGVRAAAAFMTSAYASYSGCRQYREALFDAASASAAAPRIDKLRHYFNHPGFISAFVDSVCDALAALSPATRDQAPLVFVTHSIPISMAESSGPDGDAYVEQHLSVARQVAEGVRERTGTVRGHDLAYCSRSGSPQVPWLGPDINDHLTTLRERGVAGLVVVPIGFVSDHMEVIYDLDTEAAATAAELGLEFERAQTPGVHPAFVAAIRDLLLERASVERGEPVSRVARGDLPAAWDACAAGCCPNPQGARPTLCERV
ncbi:MAG: ferrochelatase [Nocardioidaceae bacterium]